ncbi:MAG: hypothetical protein BWX68_00115 [Verrucomicrobia bacterium ADurb.Bin063]|nr:MAG: hypothetical protein BWX68_00115 [Verrucomicrobia bacterium ADurb.Bin063]
MGQSRTAISKWARRGIGQASWCWVRQMIEAVCLGPIQSRRPQGAPCFPVGRLRSAAGIGPIARTVPGIAEIISSAAVLRRASRGCHLFPAGYSMQISKIRLIRECALRILPALFKKKRIDLCDVQKALRPRSPRLNGSRSRPAEKCCAPAPAGGIYANPRAPNAAARCGVRLWLMRRTSIASNRTCRSATKLKPLVIHDSCASPTLQLPANAAPG